MSQRSDYKTLSRAKIAPYLLLGSNSVNNDNRVETFFALNSSGRIGKQVFYSHANDKGSDTWGSADVIHRAFKMVESKCDKEKIFEYLYERTDARQAVAANLVFATLFQDNLGAWRKFVSNYMAAYELEPRQIKKPPQSCNRIQYLASQYQSLKSHKTVSIHGAPPLVTVIVAVFNSADTLHYSLKSILDQDYTNVEVIAVNDASTDQSLSILESLQQADARIKIISLQNNSGPYVCRNIALAHATGEYVTCHDADDWSHPERLKRQLDEILATDAAANVCYMLRLRKDGSFTRSSPISDICSDGILRQCFSSLLVKRDYLIDIYGQWDNVRKAADSELIERIKAHDYLSLSYLKLPLVFALDSPNGLSSELSVSESNAAISKLADRNSYKSSYSYWHRSNSNGFPAIRSGRLSGRSYIIGSRNFAAPASFHVPPTTSLNQKIRDNEDDSYGVHSKSLIGDLKSANDDNHANSDEPGRLLWLFIERLGDNKELALARISDKAYLKQLIIQSRRLGFLGLIVYLLDLFASKHGNLDSNMKRIRDDARKMLIRLKINPYTVERQPLQNIMLLQRDVLVLNSIRNITSISNEGTREQRIRKRKIALVIHSLGPGGAEKQFTEWCKYLRLHKSSEFDISAVVFNSSKEHFKDTLESILPSQSIIYLDQQDDLSNQIVVNCLPTSIRQIASEKLADISFLTSKTRVQNVRKLAHFVNVNDIDGIVGFLDESFICALYASSIGKPIKCLSRFGSMPRLIGRRLSYKERWKAKLKYLIYSSLPESEDIAIGANSKKCLHEYHKIINSLSINQCRYVYLPNVIQETDEKCLLGNNRNMQMLENDLYISFLQRQQHSASSVVVGAVMRLSEEKNPLLFLSLASKLASRDVMFLLIGSGPLDKDVQQALSEYQNPYIFHLPNSKNINIWYKQIDILCLTSTVEGSPNVLLEASLNNCALLSTNVGGVSEHFSHMSSAVIVDNPSVEAIMPPLRQLISDSLLRSSLANNAKKVVKSKHDGHVLGSAISQFFSFRTSD
jgi:glycosyltransferase involved in cell wall biosynthesis